MSQRKIPIFTAIIILLLMVVPIVQATPPRQEGSMDAASLGDSFNLDDEGNVVGEVISGGMNLGTIMSGKNNTDDADDPSDDGDDTGDDTDDDGGDTGDETGDETGDDDGDTDDDDIDDGDDTDDGTDDGADTLIKQHPVAAAIADHFGVSYEEVKALHDGGYGFGNIAKAYFFAEALEMTPHELLAEARGSGWGNVLKQNGIHPGAVGHGQPDKAGPPAHAGGPNKGGQQDSLSNGQDVSGLAGPGGNGNGNGNGKGKGKDKNDHGDKGKGKGKNK
jgi:hypothetical protein